MLIEKKISKSGTVTLPAHLRRELGIEAGDRFELSSDEKGNILLTKTCGSCLICKGKKELKKYKKVYICKDCRLEIAKLDKEE